jgi:hypothetical protein
MLLWIIVGILLLVLIFMRRREGFEQPKGVRYIEVTSTTYLQMSQLKVLSGGVNVAYGKKVEAKSEIVPGMASKAVDGVSAAREFPNIYESSDEASSWMVDLGQEYAIDEIVYYNRADGCSDRASKMKMVLMDGTKTQVGEPMTFTGEQEQHFTFTKKEEKEEEKEEEVPVIPMDCALNTNKDDCDKNKCSWDADGGKCSPLTSEPAVYETTKV